MIFFVPKTLCDYFSQFTLASRVIVVVFLAVRHLEVKYSLSFSSAWFWFILIHSGNIWLFSSLMLHYVHQQVAHFMLFLVPKHGVTFMKGWVDKSNLDSDSL